MFCIGLTLKVTDDLERKVRGPEMKKVMNNPSQRNNSFRNNDSRRNVECNYCKKRGHVKNDCYKLKAKLEKEQSDNTTNDQSLNN